MQITIVGGGSYQWTPELLADLLGTESLHGAHYVLEDIDPVPLEKMSRLAGLLNESMGSGATVSATTDQRRALEGSDFVIVTISTGGFDSMTFDLDVPARFGIRQSVGDTVGPGGINRSLRNIPVLVGVAEDMGKVCPDAWLLNITNPMTCLTRAVCRQTSIRAVGLCHEVGNWSIDLAIALGKPMEAVRPTVAGVNHFPVVTALDVDGQDGFDIMAGMVEEAGGLAALAAGPRRPVAEEFSTARLRPAPCAPAHHAGQVGSVPGRRGPPHRRVPPVGADRVLAMGGRLQSRADLHRPSGRGTRPATSPTSTPGWTAPRPSRPGRRASSRHWSSTPW